MFRRINLRLRILLLLGTLALVNLAGALVTIGYIHRTQRLYTPMIDRSVAALGAAHKLETSLVKQKGLVTYYSLSSDPKWLSELDALDREFRLWMVKALDATYSRKGRRLLNEVETLYLRYDFYRDQIIGLYKEGKSGKGQKEHWDLRSRFTAIYERCEQFKEVKEENIRNTRTEYGRSARMISLLAWGAIPCGIILVLLLTVVLFRQVLEPILRLAREPGGPPNLPLIVNEVNAVRERVSGLLDNIDEARSELRESRELLLLSEKMAITGKLAAGVAHSIRNPLTSVKMRLFSLERSLSFTPEQREDMEVISEEIGNIDTIVRNFLEFARRPKLKPTLASPSEIVDTALRLTRHRIESCRVDLAVEREERLSPIRVDTDQLKEALVNLILNACEVAGEGGWIRIREEMEERSATGRVAVIRVSDNGPGIPEEFREKIFQPFFSSKEEGSGLGLSIARRIVEEHGGTLSLCRPEETVETTFEIALPARKSS